MKGKQLYLFSFQKNSKQNHAKSKVIFPSDMLILLGVVAIILFTASFCLGVEKGKRITSLKVNHDMTNSITTIHNAAESTKSPAPKKVSVELEPETKEASDKQIIENENKTAYYIQVASFKKENTAQKEAKILTETGFPVSVIKKGKYVVIYVGDFSDKEEAKDNFKLLRKKYKDCIFRRL